MMEWIARISAYGSMLGVAAILCIDLFGLGPALSESEVMDVAALVFLAFFFFYMVFFFCRYVEK